MMTTHLKFRFQRTHTVHYCSTEPGYGVILFLFCMQLMQQVFLLCYKFLCKHHSLLELSLWCISCNLTCNQTGLQLLTLMLCFPGTINHNINIASSVELAETYVYRSAYGEAIWFLDGFQLLLLTMMPKVYCQLHNIGHSVYSWQILSYQRNDLLHKTWSFIIVLKKQSWIILT